MSILDPHFLNTRLLRCNTWPPIFQIPDLEFVILDPLFYKYLTPTFQILDPMFYKSIMKQFVSSAATTHDKFQILSADSASKLHPDWLTRSLAHWVKFNWIQLNWFQFNLSLLRQVIRLGWWLVWWVEASDALWSHALICKNNKENKRYIEAEKK